MEKKKSLMFVILLLLLIATFAVIAVTLTTTETPQQTETAAVETEAAEPGIATEEAPASGTADKEAAEALVGQELSREEVQASLGEWNDFNMSSNGCERGVYAGRFYYDGFILYSRTYNQGKTFRIMSVNEQ